MNDDVFDIKEFLNNLPNMPGVYRMLAKDMAVLYVGKAVDLKRRVSSYFQKTDLSPRIALMVKQVAKIEVTITRSDKEALLLENNLIKALAPKYNILFRDDKTYPYVALSHHAFPQMLSMRGEPQQGFQYFGPYPNAYAVRESIHLLQKVFLLRTCEDSVFANRSRPCLLFQIKRCSGPCTQEISVLEYAADVKRAMLFLKGKSTEIIDSMTDEMLQASERLEFEQAAKLRDKIQALAKLQERQFIKSREFTTDVDVIALVLAQNYVCVNIVMLRAGQHLGDKSIIVAAQEDCDLISVLQVFVAQYYIGKEVPDDIVTSYPIEADILNVLQEQIGRKVHNWVNPTADRGMWLSMALKNASMALDQKMNSKATARHRQDALMEFLQLDSVKRIECFDISHTQGEATVASCVVFDRGDMQPSEYRRFNIQSVSNGDDYQAMREVLTRRYKDLVLGDGIYPDVVLIDGGKGQVGIAYEVFEQLGLNLYVLGVAKGEERKAGLETLILPPHKKEVQLPSMHPALHLIQTIRDEAHRFAITGHRNRRAKARIASSLEDIPGIGVKRRQMLLTRFGGLRGIKAASLEDIASVTGINQALAQRIYQAFHGK